jgi:hypothetical protein
MSSWKQVSYRSLNKWLTNQLNNYSTMWQTDWLLLGTVSTQNSSQSASY